MTQHRIGRADLHMHTTVSDGTMTVRQLLDEVARRGDLDIVAITDHDRLDASLWAYARRERYPFGIVPGVEVSSAEGHVLALWVMQDIPAGLSLAETAVAVHEAGGLAYLAHPFFTQMSEVRAAARVYSRDPLSLVRAGLNGIETYNASLVIPGANRAAARLAQSVGLTTIGGSDAHTLGALGLGHTLFPGITTADLRSALESQQTQAVGRPWPVREYVKFTVRFAMRRGRILFNEFDGADDPDEMDVTAVANEMR